MGFIEGVLELPRGIAEDFLPQALSRQTGAKERGECCKIAHIGSAISAAVTVTSTALEALGIASCVSGGVLMIIGVPLTVLALPPMYLGYNGYRLCNNLARIAENPDLCRVSGPRVDKAKLREELAKDTFLGQWMSDLIVDHMMEKHGDLVSARE